MGTRTALEKRHRKELSRKEKVKEKRQHDLPRPGTPEEVEQKRGLRHYSQLIVFIMVGLILGTVVILNII